jgi:hypothetical protein
MKPSLMFRIQLGKAMAEYQDCLLTIKEAVEKD